MFPTCDFTSSSPGAHTCPQTHFQLNIYSLSTTVEYSSSTVLCGACIFQEANRMYRCTSCEGCKLAVDAIPTTKQLSARTRPHSTVTVRSSTNTVLMKTMIVHIIVPAVRCSIHSRTPTVRSITPSVHPTIAFITSTEQTTIPALHRTVYYTTPVVVTVTPSVYRAIHFRT